MGQRFIRTAIAREEALVASALATYDLPVNPLSFLVYTLRWQDGAAIGDAGDPIAEALSFISRIDVLLDGSPIYSLNGADSFYMSQFLTGKIPSIINLVDAAAERHYLSWLIPFGRFPYWPNEGLGKTVRGKLQFQVTTTAAVGTVDTPVHIIEAVEMPEANPERWLRVTTRSKTPTAAGEHDVDLPIGNQIIGIGFFATTVPTGAVTNRSIGEITLLLNDEPFHITRSNWESFKGETDMWYPMNSAIDRHTHAQSVGTVVVTGMQLLGIIGRNRYAYINFDPTEDGMYVIDTAGLSRVHLTVNSEGVNDAIRVIPVELMSRAIG